MSHQPETLPEGGIPFLLPRYPPLQNDTVGQAAVNGQLVVYPKVVRALSDPPISNQQFSNVSFMLLKDPIQSESGKKVYGYVNCRGNHPSELAAKIDGERIIKTVDSRHMVRVVPTGTWFPITEDETKIRDKIDVVTDEEADKPALRTEALRQKREEELRKFRELKAHEEELIKDVTDPTPLEEKEKTLDGYCQKRVTEMKLLEMEEKYLYQLKALRYNMGRIAHELASLERDHPEYTSQWLDRYNEERIKYGSGQYVPSEKEEQYHEQSVKEADLSKPYPHNAELRHARISMI